MGGRGPTAQVRAGGALCVRHAISSGFDTRGVECALRLFWHFSLVDKWSMLLARNSLARVVSPLGWHHARGVILPFAVSDRAGVIAI